MPIQTVSPGFNAAHFSPKRGGLKLFGEDFALEQLRVAQFHEFVGVAGIAVFAAIFAAAIRIDGPDVAHPARSSPDKAARFKFQIFHLALGFQQVAGSSQAGDADEFGGRIIVEQHGVIAHFRLLFASSQDNAKITKRSWILRRAA